MFCVQFERRREKIGGKFALDAGKGEKESGKNEWDLKKDKFA